MFRNPGISIGRFLGIPVTIHPSWFIILALLTMTWGNFLMESSEVTHGTAYAAALVSATIAFITLLAHEFGHALAARYYGIGTERITLFMLGGVAYIKDEPRRPLDELVIAIAGPLVSFFCMILFYVLGWVIQRAGAPDAIVFIFEMVANINLVFVLFNMLPGFPMDGGRVLRALSWMVVGDYLKATRFAAGVGKGVTFLLGAVGVFLVLGGSLQGITLIIAAVFLNWLGRRSLENAVLRSAFEHRHVSDFLRPVQVVIPSHITLRQAIRDFIQRIHGDRFPVVQGGELLGSLSADDLVEVPREQWEHLPVSRFVRPYRRRDYLTPELQVATAWKMLSQRGIAYMPVFHGRILIGTFHVDDVVNYLERIRKGEISGRT